MILGLLVGLMAAMLPGVAAAKSVKAKTDCKHGGWTVLVDDNGVPFTSEKDCKGFAKAGGTPAPPGTILAIAYTNVDLIDGYDAAQGDVLIARLVDTDDNGLDQGDRLEMGRYPTSFSEPYAFADWGEQSQLVTSLDQGDTPSSRPPGTMNS